MTRNKGWLNLTETTIYPLKDGTSGVDDGGNFLPVNLFADLKLIIPESLPEFVYIQGVTVREKVVSLVIGVADNESNPTYIQSILAITLPKPTETHRAYKLEPLADGCGGLIIWGHAIEEGLEYTGRFSIPKQSQIVPTAIHRFRDYPIPKIKVKGVEGEVTGNVVLRGIGDLEVVEECIDIPDSQLPTELNSCGSGQERKVFTLKLYTDKRNEAVQTLGDVLKKYTGCCGGRPESDSCYDTTPIEAIAGVRPDCNGRITIEFQGDVKIAKIIERLDPNTGINYTCGIGISTQKTLDDVCVKDLLPDSSGNLPGGSSSLCVDTPKSNVLSDPTDPDYFLDPNHQSQYFDPTLPFNVDFEKQDSKIKIRRGGASFAVDHRGNRFLTTEKAGKNSTNVITYMQDLGSWYRKVTTEFQILDKGVSYQKNAGVIIGYRPVSGQVYQYAAAEVSIGEDNSFGLLKIVFFDGYWTFTLDSIELQTFEFDLKYRLWVKAHPNPNDTDNAWLFAGLETVDTYRTPYQIGPIYLKGYGGHTGGEMGLLSRSSLVRFFSWSIDNA